MIQLKFINLSSIAEGKAILAATIKPKISFLPLIKTEIFMQLNKLKILRIGFLVLIFLLGFVVRLYKFNGPVADWHSWRQADTSSVSRNFVNKGFDILHPTFRGSFQCPVRDMIIQTDTALSNFLFIMYYKQEAMIIFPNLLWKNGEGW